MKYTTQLLLLILAIALTTSCSDDSTGPTNNRNLPYFTLNDGNVWYYDDVIVVNEVDSVNRKYEEYISEPKVIGGKNCFKFNVIEVGVGQDFSFHEYVRTDESGYYIFFDYLFVSEREPIDKLKNVWVKYIDFKQDNWTQLDLKFDTLYANDERQRSYINLSGSTVKSEDVEYKGMIYPTFKTIFKITIEDTLSIDNDIIRINNEISGLEITYIKSIGIYKRKFIYNDEISDSYQILTDHK